MTHRVIAAITVLACAVTLESCLLRKSEEENEGPPPETLLSVENRHWSDVTIYVLRGNARVRMGTVTSMNTVRFVFPAVLVGNVTDIRLMADPIGNDPYVSEPVTVGPGDLVEFRLANDLTHSSVWVR
jgi:hypothetical protein